MKALVKWITGWTTEDEHKAVREHARKWLARLAVATRQNADANAKTVHQQEGQAHE